MNECTSSPLLVFEELSVGSKLSLEILSKLREKLNEEDAAIADARGITVMLPHDLLSEDEIAHWHDFGIHVVFPEDTPSRETIVVGAGFPSLCLPALIGHWNENEIKHVEPTYDPYSLGPTSMRRGGNNKPWYNPALKKNRAKIAKQSKRRNRK